MTAERTTLLQQESGQGVAPGNSLVSTAASSSAGGHGGAPGNSLVSTAASSSAGDSRLLPTLKVVITKLSGAVVFRSDMVTRDMTVQKLKLCFSRDTTISLTRGAQVLEDDETLMDWPPEVHLHVIFKKPFYEEGVEEDMGNKYVLTEKIGHGTYGTVYKGRPVSGTGAMEYVAIKQIGIQYEDEGIPTTSLREIALLIDLRHPNVVCLQEVLPSRNNLFLVFEFCDMDLKMFLRNEELSAQFSDPIAFKKAVTQCFEGVSYCHSNRILHRDLKTQNILVNIDTMRLKLADFGLARIYAAPLKVYTHEVITLWYRAIEILLGQVLYDVSVDVWSLGCIVAEMATREALFPGDSEIDTIFRIFRALGTPTAEDWPGLEQLPCFSKRYPIWQSTGLEDVLEKGPVLGKSGISFLKSCLKYNGAERPSARRLLRHEFLT